ncbi:Protein of unknown function [Gryllus bimaculatus]|nr:Protein of unknown function [Gryllus bimaculatus]
MDWQVHPPPRRSSAPVPGHPLQRIQDDGWRVYLLGYGVRKVCSQLWELMFAWFDMCVGAQDRKMKVHKYLYKYTNSNKINVPESEQESITTENPSEQLSEEELIAVVNQSAEEGIAFFSNLLGLTFGGGEGGDNSTETATNEDNATPPPSVETTAPSPE